MIKDFLKTAFHSLGYSVSRRPTLPPPAPPAAPCRPVRPLRVDLFPGFPVELDFTDCLQRRALQDGVEYEAPGPALLRAFCTDGVTFFDIGANFGYYSYYILAHCPSVIVHSFEPNPAHVSRQHAVAAAFASRYRPHQLGLSDAAGELDLTISSLDSGWSTFGDNPDFKDLAATLTRQRIPVMAFDSWCAAAGFSVSPEANWVVKIDVEGYEPRVLRGMRRALTARAFKAVFIEVLDHTLHFCGTSAAEVFRLLDEAGYEAFDDRLRPTSLQAHEARNVLFLPRVGMTGP